MEQKYSTKSPHHFKSWQLRVHIWDWISNLCDVGEFYGTKKKINLIHKKKVSKLIKKSFFEEIWKKKRKENLLSGYNGRPTRFPFIDNFTHSDSIVSRNLNPPIYHLDLYKFASSKKTHINHHFMHFTQPTSHSNRDKTLPVELLTQNTPALPLWKKTIQKPLIFFFFSFFFFPLSHPHNIWSILISRHRLHHGYNYSTQYCRRYL